MKLTELHENSMLSKPLGNAMDLGNRIAKAMQLSSQYNKMNQKTPRARKGMLAQYPHYNISPIPGNPRHRRFFGLRNPHTPY